MKKCLIIILVLVISVVCFGKPRCEEDGHVNGPAFKVENIKK